MRIVFFSYSYWPPDFGGDLLITIERFQSLVKAGNQVTVLTSGRKGFPDRLLMDGIQVLRSPVIGEKRLARLVRRIIFWFWCFYKLCTIPMDVVHQGEVGGIDAWSSALVGGLLSWVTKMRNMDNIWVFSLAETDADVFPSFGKFSLLKKIRFSFVDKIISISPALQQGVEFLFPNKALFIPYGVRDDLFRPLDVEEGMMFRSRHGADENNVIFTFLGSLGKRKGLDLLAQNFSELAVDHPEWKLWIVGPRTRMENANVDEAEVDQVIKPLAVVQGQVVFWGRVNDRQELSCILGSSDVFVFPSRREGMGIAPMEAMACGLPVIISRIPGVTDVVNIENETGLYVPPGDLHALKAAMLRLGEDSELRHRMGVHARKRIVKDFGWEQHVEKWKELYREQSELK